MDYKEDDDAVKVIRAYRTSLKDKYKTFGDYIKHVNTIESADQLIANLKTYQSTPPPKKRGRRK